jgi:hypothetical protein
MIISVKVQPTVARMKANVSLTIVRLRVLVEPCEKIVWSEDRLVAVGMTGAVVNAPAADGAMALPAARAVFDAFRGVPFSTAAVAM